MAVAPLDHLREAYSARRRGVPEPPADGRPVVACLGSGVPIELIDAAGLRAVRVCGDPAAPTADADRVAEAAVDSLARSQLQRLIDGTHAGAAEVWVAHDTEASARLFHYARECRHQGAPLGEVVPVELVGGALAAQHADRMAVLAELRRRVEALAGRSVTDEDLAASLVRSDERRRSVGDLLAWRRRPTRRLSGSDSTAIVGAAATMSAGEHLATLRRLAEEVEELAPRDGRPVLLTGSATDDDRLVGVLEDRGLLVVGEDHDWGAAWFDHAAGDHVAGADPWVALADRYGPHAAPRTGRASISARAAYTARLAAEAGAEVVVAVLRRGDDGPPWDVPAQRRALAEHGIPLVAVPLGGYGIEHVEPAADTIVDMIADVIAADVIAADVLTENASPPRTASHGRGDGAPATVSTPTRSSEGGDRGPRPKGLEASAIATAHQRAWFAELREQVAAGASLAVVNADAPHEILRAMGIPYVVNQWWASVCAAKQQGPRYLAHLRRLGYPDDIDAYSAMALGSALDPDPTDAPWGGLPPVDLLVAETTTDPTGKIFETWADAQKAELVLLDAPLAPLEPRRWFDHIHDDWERVLGSRRLDLMVGEIHDMIERIEERTGRRFDLSELERVMALANEQAGWNARTRDLIARAVPAPINVADAIPATMLPQWHRGSEWGRDAARRLHDEVAALVGGGHGVVPDEQVRLMWIGRGLWFDMGFYERFQERHGAVFVWSMYLAVAADAYLRRGDDAIRTLAARFCGFADLYNTPPWSAEWYAKEALHNQVDGVVHLTTDAVRGTHFITRAIEEAGVPVLEIGGSNVDSRDWDRDEVSAAIETFIAQHAAPTAQRRRAQKA